MVWFSLETSSVNLLSGIKCLQILASGFQIADVEERLERLEALLGYNPEKVVGIGVNDTGIEIVLSKSFSDIKLKSP